MEREIDRQRDANNPFKHVGVVALVSDLMTMGGAVSVLATQ